MAQVRQRKTKKPQARRIGDVLTEAGVISKRDLTKALEHQKEHGGRLGEVVIALRLADERAVASALAEHFSIPFVDLRKERADAESLLFIDEEYAKQFFVLPLRVDDDGALVVAAADPTDQETLDELATATDKEIRPVVASRSDILRTIEQSYQAFADVEAQAKVFQERLRPRIEKRDAHGAASLEALTAAAPAVQIVNLLVEQGLRDRASDVHLEPQEDRLRVRYRIDGALHDVASLPVEVGPSVASRIKILANMNIVEKHRPQDGQIQMNVDGQAVDIRAATTSTIWGEKVVLRLLPKNRELLQLPDLGMSPDVYEQFSHLVRSPFGMMIVAGPTGAGKTTTLYAALSELDKGERNIMTIEDPVEYVFPDINQIQIREQSGVSFAAGLKAILRQDPDVILVGEMRDVDTARIGVQSALTGHLVMSSLHATDSVAALIRFLDMGIEPFLVTAAVVGVVAQRLLRRLCTNCTEDYKPPADELAFYRAHARGPAKRKFLRGAGCNFCNQTGYLDRVGVFELLKLTDRIKKMVVEEAPYEQVKKVAIAEGMVTLQQRAVEKVNQDVTTLAEAVRTLYEVR